VREEKRRNDELQRRLLDQESVRVEKVRDE